MAVASRRNRALQQAHDALSENWSPLTDFDHRGREVERLLRGDTVSPLAIRRLRLLQAGDFDTAWEVEIDGREEDRVRANATAAGLAPGPRSLVVRSNRFFDTVAIEGGPLPRLWRSCGCMACVWPMTLGRHGTCECAELGCWCVADGHQRKDGNV